jgi:tRNA 2-thiouridine synthesizing protein A
MAQALQKKIIDSRGSFCPGPITDLFKAYRQANLGDVIELWATDPAAKSDVQAWATRSGNTVLDITDEPGYIRILLRIDRAPVRR